MTLVAVLLCCGGTPTAEDAMPARSTPAQTGSWGDQGDGTYRNPILNADYPDIAIVRRDDTYYMISARQFMSPGMVILRSHDLVNWRSLGHVWPTLSWRRAYDWDRMAAGGYGVWAGDLAFHEGRWYCYQIDPAYGLIVSTAENITGPWTEPKRLLDETVVFDDPGVYFDHDTRQAYLICNTRRKVEPSGGKSINHNHIFKLSWDGLHIEDEGTLVHSGPWAEAGKIMKIDGRFFIFLVEWYTPDPNHTPAPGVHRGDRKQIVLRSTTDSIYGPYEKRIVLERGNGVERSCSQGSLVTAPDGSWWFVHQMGPHVPNPFQGRPLSLQPVVWRDGWPIIGKEDGDSGRGKPIMHHRKPIDGFPIDAPATDDDFAGPSLAPQWEWYHNPRPTHWSLTERPGWLRLRASVPVGKGGFWKACNTLSQRIMGDTTGTASVRMDTSGMQPGQVAGLVRFSRDAHRLGVRCGTDGGKRVFWSDGETAIDGPEPTGSMLELVTTNEGDQARFAWRVEGGDLQYLGPVCTIGFRGIGNRIGLFCWNDEREAGHADFTRFRYDYDGPKRAGSD